MNLPIDTLNTWADNVFRFAWPMLWQSSLLIGVLFVLDWLLRRNVRPAVRYAMWLVLLVKLVLPPSLAFPTGAGWWLHTTKAVPAKPHQHAIVVTYGADPEPVMPTTAAPVFVAPPPPRFSREAWALLGTAAVSLGLLACMVVRWWQVASDAHRAEPAPGALCERFAELRCVARLRLTERHQSPAVCGLFRPVILLPRSLAEQLPAAQLRAVLLHELVHLRRGDVWVNCVQGLLQVAYWWHPLLWLANARIRRVREEAVDDAVMLALNEDADSYAPTLLEVAKLALRRPLASLGLVGILESRSSLRQRIERLIEFHPPRKAGLGLASALAVLGFAALAVPMGEAPAPGVAPEPAPPQVVTNSPAPETPSPAGGVLEKKAKAGTLVHDGKLLYEMGKLDEANAKLKLALEEDPQNQAAMYYLNLVAEAKTRPAPAKKPETLPVPTPSARTNLIHSSRGRQAILNKLDRIRFDSTSWDHQPLSAVLRTLVEETRKRDPDKVGVNFILTPGTSTNAPDLGELSALPITLQPSLTNLHLGDVLDAIVLVAPRPIKYSIEDYAVVFSPRTETGPALYIRTFKVDPNALVQSLRLTKVPIARNGPAAISSALQDFFAKAGVDLDPATHPGKSVFFNDRQGMLLVRATLQDLDMVETAIQVLNAVPPQINIKARFVEVSQDDSKAMGFDWFLGNVLITNGSKGGPAGTIPSSNGVPTAAHGPDVFAGNLAAGANAPLLTSGVRAGGKPPFSLTGILTDPQYRVVLKALQQREPAAELVAQPEVTTLSGRQAQCKVMDVSTIVTGIKQEALTPPGLTGTNTSESFPYTTEQMEFGPVLDVMPTVLPDGYTVNLTVIASLTEFLGYEDSRTNRVTVYLNGKRHQVNRPRPRFHTAQMTSQVNVWDGQTLVLGGLVSETITTIKDSVAGLGNLPLVGKLFRSESRSTQKKNMLVFITPMIIDPAGNRVHSEEEMPFTRNAVPPQPAH